MEISTFKEPALKLFAGAISTLIILDFTFQYSQV